MAKTTTPTSKARPDLRAYEQSIRLDTPSVVHELMSLISPKLVAYIAGVGETRAVKEWASGDRAPRGEVESRLRTALRIAAFIAQHDGNGVVQAWFQGLNPQLNDVSPARVLRTEPPEEAGAAVLAAARAFVVGG